MSRGTFDRKVHWRYTPRRAWCGVDVGDDTLNVASDDRLDVTCKRCHRTMTRVGVVRPLTTLAGR